MKVGLGNVTESQQVNCARNGGGSLKNSKPLGKGCAAGEQ